MCQTDVVKRKKAYHKNPSGEPVKSLSFLQCVPEQFGGSPLHVPFNRHVRFRFPNVCSKPSIQEYVRVPYTE